MPILVNGGTTKDFKGTRGLIQGDPLSPFLFSIVAEGLACLVRRAGIQGLFCGFRLNEIEDNIVVQFTDEIVLICEVDWKKL
ncbi:unnamed protein product [Lathyrus sativus]|nr:unnamed protein product [Lathyrus sativus]